MKKTIFTLAFALLCSLLGAQIIEPVQWSATLQNRTDSTAQVLVTATLEPGWHLYGLSLPEGGPKPTTFQIPQTIAPLQVTGEPKTVFDENFQMELSFFEDSVTFTQLCRFQAGDTLRCEVEYMACNDAQCLPPTVFAFTLPASSPALAEETIAPVSTANHSLWWIFWMGFLGGLLAIFTPCVWPIIPMTVSFFLKKKDAGVRSALLYGLCIVLIYVGLGLLVTILFGASALNALSTNAVVNLFFFALLVVFALSFFGLFEITLPASWSTALDAKARATGGLLSILLMAFTLVIVSFSCTGPIIGTLLVEAASGSSYLGPALGMFGFALALALPFTVFALFPHWMSKMPRSGGWMTSFKVVLAFIELALSLKFLSVADLAYGWGILPRWLFFTLWILIFFGLGIYLLVGIARLSNVRKVVRAVLVALSFGFVGYLVPGLWGAPCKMVSAFAPPLKIASQAVFDDFETGMAFAKQEHKPVLLDFSGYGCVNCRKMEAYILHDEQVQQRLQNYVLIELYVDDKRDSIGLQNSRLQQTRFGSNAQPYYIQLNESGDPISEPYAFSIDVEDFLTWLKY